MCLNMFFSGSGQLKPLFNSDITAEDSVSLGAEFLGVHITLQGVYVEYHHRIVSTDHTVATTSFHSLTILN